MKAEYRSSIRSKNIIKKTLLELMQEKSFDDITVTDVVDRADINRGTFYAHYKNTRDVLKHINEEMLNSVTASIEMYSADYIFMNPRNLFQSISNAITKDLNYYRLAFRIGGIPDYISENKQQIFDYFLSSNTGKVIEGLLGRQYFLCILDFWVSGILNLYYDSLTGRIPMSIAELPDFCTAMVELFTSRDIMQKVLPSLKEDLDKTEARTSTKPEKHQ